MEVVKNISISVHDSVWHGDGSAAVYGEGLARDEGGGGRGEEHDGGRHLLRRAGPPQRVQLLRQTKP